MFLLLRPSARRFSTASPMRTVRDILDEKRGYLAGDDLSHYLKRQFKLMTISQKESVATALDLMIKNRTPVLMVMNEKEVAGIVTDNDYLKLAHKRKQASANIKPDEELPVSEVMTPCAKLVSVGYADTIERCQELMVRNQVRFLPVMLNSKLHGVLSYSDFLTQPSRFEPEARRAIFGEEGTTVITDDYSFSLTDLEGDKIKEELAKRVEAIKNRKL